MCSAGARIALPLVLVLLAYAQLSAQEFACAKVDAVPGMTGYRARAGDARCEGFYQSRVSGASLEPLSLTAGPVNYQLHKQGVLRIVAPDVSRLRTDQIHVQARALPLGTYYRMDAIVRSAQSLTWAMDAVLAPAQLTPDTIGVVAWIEQNGARIYVPVRVSDSSGPTPQGTRIITIMRATADLDSLIWRVLAQGDARASPEWNKLQRGRHMLRAGQPIELEPLDAGRDMTVEVQAKPTNSDMPFSLRLRIFGS